MTRSQCWHYEGSKWSGLNQFKLWTDHKPQSLMGLLGKFFLKSQEKLQENRSIALRKNKENIWDKLINKFRWVSM